MTTACLGWLGRDFLTRTVPAGAVWVTPDLVRLADGTEWPLPPACGHDPADCPPQPATVPTTRQEAA